MRGSPQRDISLQTHWLQICLKELKLGGNRLDSIAVASLVWKNIPWCVSWHQAAVDKGGKKNQIVLMVYLRFIEQIRVLSAMVTIAPWYFVSLVRQKSPDGKVLIARTHTGIKRLSTQPVFICVYRYGNKRQTTENILVFPEASLLILSYKTPQ